VPSIYEPFGLVALEAMASGCPCIVADTGGLREVVPPGERVGLRFNGGDAEHLGLMIERLLIDHDLRDRLVTEASEHVLRFDWDDVSQRTLAVYSDLSVRNQAEARDRDSGVMREPARGNGIRRKTRANGGGG
jgi:glycogen synthase